MSSAATNAAIVFAKTFVSIKIFQLWNWAKTSLKPFSMFFFGISIILAISLSLPRSSIDDLVFSVFFSNFFKLSYKISLLKIGL